MRLQFHPSDCGFSPPKLLEPLESRTLLAASFASVGFLHGADTHALPSADVWATEGSLNNALGAAGSVFDDGPADRAYSRALWYDSITNLGDGRFLRNPGHGYLGANVERNGARFLTDDGYRAGWYFTDYGSSTQELELFVQTGSVTESSYYGNYRYNILNYSTTNHTYSASSGRMTIDSDKVTYAASVGTVPYTSSTLRAMLPNGALSTARDEYFYRSKGGSTVIFADMSTDGSISLGAAVLENFAPTRDQMVGGYLFAYAAVTSINVQFRQYYLDLEPDGDYRIYDLDAYDDGNRDALERGFWSISGSNLLLDVDKSDDSLTLVIGEGLTLLGVKGNTKTSTTPYFGLATKAAPKPADVGPAPVFSVPAVNEFSRQAVFEIESDKKWYRTDLIIAAGGPNITGPMVTWVDAKDGRTYAAAVTASGLVLYSQSLSHAWSYRNLTTEITGAVAITSELQVMAGPDDTIHLTGLSPAGDLIRYYQNGALRQDGSFSWSSQNISTEQLAPQGLTTPAFTGLRSYATSWNGLNIAGLDDTGVIWSVWWAPGLANWQVSNLTTAYNAEALSGGLTVYLTSWGGINIAGTGVDGHLRVTWWVPSLGGEWRQADLTTDTGGPLLDPPSVSSYVSSWGGLNISGVDQATGKVVVYWWSPERTALGWAVSNLSDAVPSGSLSLTAPLQGVAGSDGSLNVFGYNNTSFVRYYWEPNSSWLVQNLTQISTPRA